MGGLTNKPPADLLPLAKSWLSPPELKLDGEGYRSLGYDPTQRAYVLSRQEKSPPAPLKIVLSASNTSPLWDPAIVIRSWGDAAAQLKIDGKPVTWGKDFRVGHVDRLEGRDLVIWIQKQTSQAMRVEVTPVTR